MEKRSSSRLKQRLVRMFQTSTLLRSPCSSSTSASTLRSGPATSSQTFLTDTTANEPVIITGNHLSLRGGNAKDTLSPHHPSSLESLDRSLSLRLSLDDHRRPRSSSRFSLDCVGCQPSRFSDVCGIPPLMGKAKKERRLRETGGSYETGRKEGKMCPPTVFPTHPSKNCYYYYNKMEDRKKKKKNKKKKKLLSNGYGFTSSSSDSNGDEFGFFSGEEREVDKGEEETETFFSSRSFSSDSSEFYQRNSKSKKKTQRTTRRPLKSSRGSSYRPVVPVSSKEGQEEGGFAVVKRSSDPYADFRTSMVEMIVELQKFGTNDMEWLLQSYISLNNPRHHPVIIKAFTDIWEALFSN